MNDESHTPQNPPSETPPTTGNLPGIAPTPGQAAILERIDSASSGAVDQFLAETKRKPGQRGPDKRPRKSPGKKVPMASMGGTTDPSSLEESPAPLFADPVQDMQAFDEATAKTLVELSIGLMNDGASAIVRAIAKKETGDNALADEAAKSVVMSAKIVETVTKGGVECARKYAVRMDYAPEMMLFGGLAIWAGQVSLACRALRATGADIRAKKKSNTAPQ